MDGRRTALIVASDEFEHAGLSRLQAPLADAEALAGVLGDPQIGGFQVEVVHNAPSHAVQARVEDLFAEGRPDDLLLLHFSGHGLKSDSGELFFAATNTRPDRLASTAVSADFVQRCMRGSRARSIVLLLDCCYGGAFGEGVAVRAAGAANVLDSFPAGKLGGGRGRAVITASSAMEYAFEGSALATDDQVQPSVFTSAVVEGLSSGAADRDEDGLVSLNELYDYVFDRVRAQNPNQTPSRDIELQGELYVARSQRRRVRAEPLPPDLRAAVQDENMYTRLGAVGELRARLTSADEGVALGAREALQRVARSDTSYVADAARDALAANPSAGVPIAAPLLGTPPPTAHPTMPFVPTPSPSPTPAPADATSATRATDEAVPDEAVPDEAAPGGTVPDLTTGSAAARVVGVVQAKRSPGPDRRPPAGRTLLTGGALMMLSVVLPDFVYSDNAYAFHHELTFVLLCVGGISACFAAATLFVPRLRTHWRGPAVALTVALAVAGAVTLWLVLAASSDLGSSEVDFGIWVALGGCLTTVAAGVVAVLDGRRVAGRAGSGATEARPPVTTAARVVGTWAIVASATIILATFTVRFDDNTQAMVEPDLVWAWLFPGFVGLAAGILTLRLRRRPEVGPALATGAGAAALWGVWDMPRTWLDRENHPLNAGFFLEFAGLLGLIVVAAGAVALLRREHSLHLTRPDWRVALLSAAVGALAAVPFLRVASANFDNGKTGNAVHDLEMVALVVLVPLLIVTIRPEELSRIVLLGWSFAAVGTVVAYWRLLRRGGFPLFGTPYALLALAAFVVIALAVRTGPATPGGRTRTAAG